MSLYSRLSARVSVARGAPARALQAGIPRTLRHDAAVEAYLKLLLARGRRS